MADPTTADRVRAGLVLLVADPRWWPAAHAAAFRNRLLDEGGGDARAHVALVWRLHELRVGDRLAQADGAPIARCRAVARDLAVEAFLDRDAAWWGVVTWGLALGVVDEAAVAAEVAARATAPSPMTPQAVAAPRAVPRPTGAAAPGRPTAAATTGAAPPKRRWTIGTPGTPRSPLPRGPSPRAVAGLLVVIAGAFAAVIGGARLLRPARAAVVPATPASVVDVAEPRDMAAAPPGDSSSTPPSSSSTSPAAAPAPDVPAGIRGEVRLRDGRRLGGIIDLVTASDVFLHDTTSGLPMAMPLAFVAEVRTADGRVAWTPPTGVEPVGTAAAPVALRARGVGGTYRVTVRQATVDGDPACREAWAAAPPVLLEQIAHVPGATEASLESRPGVMLRIAQDGGFVAGPTAGVDGNTRWRFAMQGRFAPEGFLASSDLRTETTLRWRKVQRCWIRADLAGVRRR